VTRERLFTRLDRALARPAAWVSGPPGAGKTTLVASYVQTRRLECLWYHVDEGDVDLASFFYYLALAAARPGSTRSPLPHLTSEYVGGEAAFARRFFRELITGTLGLSALVFDDLSRVPREAPLHAALCQGLEELPPSTKLILISREEPSPPFARPIANGLLDRVGGGELLLTSSEGLAVARAHAAPGTRRTDLSRACERAAGWAAGIVLIASATGAPDDNTASSPALFDYLAGEIFDGAEPEARRVLVDVALLSFVPAQLANQVCSSPRAEAILDELARKAYFTLRGGDAEPAFELLFREFLLARARSHRSPDELRRFRVRAGTILAEAGHPEPALELFLEAEAWDDAVRVLLAISPRLHDTGRTNTFERWVSAIPAELRLRHPWLLYWLGLCRLPFDPETARAHLSGAFAGLEEAGDVEGVCLAWAAIIETIIQQWTDFRELDGWLYRFEEFRRRQVAPVAPQVEQRVTIGMFAALAFGRPDSPALRALEERAFQLASDHSVPLPVRVVIAHWLTVWCAMRGENAQAEAVVDAISSLARAEGVPPLTALTWLNAEAVHCWHVGAPSRAARAVGEGLALARTTGVHVWDHNLQLESVTAALAADDLGEARAALATAKQLAPNNPLALSSLEHFRGLVALRGGERDLALESGRLILAAAERTGFPFSEVLGRLVMALTFTAEGDAAAARPHLEALRRIGIAMQSHFMPMICDLCDADLSRRAGDLGAARASVARAFRISHEKHIAPDVWFSRRQLGDLCALALEAGLETEYARNLVARLRLEPDGLAQALEEWPWPVQVRVLGRFEARVGGESLRFSGRAQRRPLDVLAALVATERPEAGEQVIADLLWPESDGDLAKHALETALYRLRKLLGHRVILHRDRALRIDERCCWVDVVALGVLLASARACLDRHDLAAALAAAERAIRLYRGPFLADREEAWVLQARRRLRGKLKRAIAELARCGAPPGRVRDFEAWITSADLAAGFQGRASEP
jgi:LuxR family transcriptional regulator, maltose regulon positive regulatory protein